MLKPVPVLNRDVYSRVMSSRPLAAFVEVLPGFVNAVDKRRKCRQLAPLPDDVNTVAGVSHNKFKVTLQCVAKILISWIYNPQNEITGHLLYSQITRHAFQGFKNAPTICHAMNLIDSIALKNGGDRTSM